MSQVYRCRWWKNPKKAGRSGPRIVVVPPLDAVTREWIEHFFVSHVWEGKTHPDPNGTQLRHVKELATFLIDQFTGVLLSVLNLPLPEGFVFDKVIQPWTHLLTSVMSVSDIAFLKSAEGYAEQRRYVAENLGLWYDYEVVPQKPHISSCEKCRKKQQSDISSILSMTRVNPVILVADDAEAATRRGWVLSETTTSLTTDSTLAWSPSEKRISAIFFHKLAPRLMDREGCQFTNGSDGKKLRILQFAQMALEPHCFYAHTEHLLWLAGGGEEDKGRAQLQIPPSTEGFQSAVAHPDMRKIRYEDEAFCEEYNDTRNSIRKIANQLIRCDFSRDSADVGGTSEAKDVEISAEELLAATYVQHSSALTENERFVHGQLKKALKAVEPALDRELHAGLRCFPDKKRQVEEAVELRRRLVKVCFSCIAEILVNDGDFRQPYLQAKAMVVELASLLDQYRIVEGEVALVTTTRQLSESFLSSADVRTLPDYIPESGLYKFSRFERHQRSDTFNYTHDELFQ